MYLQVRYAEDLYVVRKISIQLRTIRVDSASQGYKHFQHRKIKPLFAFG